VASWAFIGLTFLFHDDACQFGRRGIAVPCPQHDKIVMCPPLPSPFAQISHNWRARPLTSRLAIVELIAATNAGFTVACELDTTTYSKGIKISDAEMATLHISADDFHPKWN
jgi:hypothetical protein